ncbi:MAG: hypothetical protein JWO50_633 [Candidatus Kaiserbacteria bacterium]|nr:hypothetical protein [Candidatus Kaiserbacteria bacterium]
MLYRSSKMATISVKHAALMFIRVYPDGYSNAVDEDGNRAPPPPLGIVVVIERATRDPLFKLPGGGRKNNERPIKTAIREVLEETGLSVKEKDTTYVCHWVAQRNGVRFEKYIFVGNIEYSELKWMGPHHSYNEGEEASFITYDQFYELVREGKFMSEHFRKLIEFSVILPCPPITVPSS